MLSLDNRAFSPNTIIDLVVEPGMPVDEIVLELAQGASHVIVFDTQGNLRCDAHYDKLCLAGVGASSVCVGRPAASFAEMISADSTDSESREATEYSYTQGNETLDTWLSSGGMP